MRISEYICMHTYSATRDSYINTYKNTCKNTYLKNTKFSIFSDYLLICICFLFITYVCRSFILAGIVSQRTLHLFLSNPGKRMWHKIWLLSGTRKLYWSGLRVFDHLQSSRKHARIRWHFDDYNMAMDWIGAQYFSSDGKIHYFQTSHKEAGTEEF